MNMSEFMTQQERIIERPERRKTLQRLQMSIAKMGQTMNLMKRSLLIASVITAAFCGAMFGLVLTANEISKETNTNTSIHMKPMLMDTETNSPVSVMSIPYKEEKPLNFWSIDELLELEKLRFVDDKGATNVFKVDGITYTENVVIFYTPQGKYMLGPNGGVAPISEEDEEAVQMFLAPSRRNMLGGTGNGVCMITCWGSWGCAYNPAGCGGSGVNANPCEEQKKRRKLHGKSDIADAVIDSQKRSRSNRPTPPSIEQMLEASPLGNIEFNTCADIAQAMNMLENAQGGGLTQLASMMDDAFGVLTLVPDWLLEFCGPMLEPPLPCVPRVFNGFYCPPLFRFGAGYNGTDSEFNNGNTYIQGNATYNIATGLIYTNDPTFSTWDFEDQGIASAVWDDLTTCYETLDWDFEEIFSGNINVNPNGFTMSSAPLGPTTPTIGRKLQQNFNFQNAQYNTNVTVSQNFTWSSATFGSGNLNNLDGINQDSWTGQYGVPTYSMNYDPCYPIDPCEDALAIFDWIQSLAENTGMSTEEVFEFWEASGIGGCSPILCVDDTFTNGLTPDCFFPHNVDPETREEREDHGFKQLMGHQNAQHVYTKWASANPHTTWAFENQYYQCREGGAKNPNCQLVLSGNNDKRSYDLTTDVKSLLDSERELNTYYMGL